MSPPPLPSLRIGIVTETYPPEVNGVAATVDRFARGLSARAHDVQIIRPRQSPTAQTPDFAAIHTTLVPGIPLPGYRELRMGLPAGRQLDRVWGNRMPDVVYVATQGLLGWSAVNWTRRNRVPVFTGFHTNFHSYSRCYRLGFLRRFIFDYLRHLHNRSNCTLVPTESLRLKLLDLSFRNVEVIGRGVDANLFSPMARSEELRRKWGATPRDPVFLYVGRLAREKNLPLAVQAFKEVLKHKPGAKMVVVGSGPLLENLRSANPDVVFCGTKTGKELAAHYASADMFVFPSETETFGNVVLEAMASGLAVIAYNYAAARVLVESGVNGMLATPGDSHDFISRVKQSGSIPDLAPIRKRARERALACDWEKIIDRFEAMLYRYSKEVADAHGKT